MARREDSDERHFGPQNTFVRQIQPAALPQHAQSLSQPQPLTLTHPQGFILSAPAQCQAPSLPQNGRQRCTSESVPACGAKVRAITGGIMGDRKIKRGRQEDGELERRKVCQSGVEMPP